MEQKAYVIHRSDNVATALSELSPEIAQTLGAITMQIPIREKIPIGHKVAIKTIEQNSMIIKYGIAIGIATQSIHAGEWVHLHVMRSQYDDRSSHLDPVTGTASDIHYD